MPFPLYAFAELGGAPPLEHKLHKEIVAAGPYTSNFLGVRVDYVALTVLVAFDVPPSAGNQLVVDGVIAAHDGVEIPMPQPYFVLTKSFAAGGGGGADDVIIYDAEAPYSFRIVNSYVYVSTAVALATLQLRDALGGVGNVLSDLWVTTLVGVKINVALPTSIPTIPSGGTLVLRRSSDLAAGEAVVLIERIG